MVNTRQDRIIVCGGGLAGLSAAVTALENGAPVTLFEKAPALGGTTAISGGLVWTYTDYDRMRADIPHGDPALQWLVYDNIGPGRTWLASLGADFGPEQDFLGIGRGPRIDPPQALDALARRFTTLGGDLRVESALDTLITKDGVIHGARFASDGRVKEEPARAVILATGGFQGNPELLTRYVIRDPDNLYLRASAWSTGDGFLAATQVGAAASPGLDTFYGHALTAPPARVSKLQFRDLTQFYGRQSIAVNLLGERFADESDGNAEDTLNQRLAQQPQGRGFYIIDRDVLESRPILGNDILTKVIVERARAAEAPVIFADTIEDLCRGLVGYGIPERKLLHEIKEFNRLIEADQADDIKPPRRRNRESLRRPPFIAVGVKASITFTMGGLQIDERTRVLRRAGGTSPSVAMPMGRAFMQEDSACLSIGDDYRQMAIEGLYAAGSDTGNISHFSYMGGLAAALTTGCTAGRSAAEFVKKLSK